VNLPGLPTTLMLAFGALEASLVPAIVVGASRDAREDAERRLARTVAQLAEFVPAEAKPKGA
jgi:hypothetical protein